MSAVGQGGERCCTLLYSLRLLPERLQAVAPGCSNFALATWIHRHTDPWLTLQVALLGHTIQYCTDASNYFKVVNSKLLSQGCHLKVVYLHISSIWVIVPVLTKKSIEKIALAKPFGLSAPRNALVYTSLLGCIKGLKFYDLILWP